MKKIQVGGYRGSKIRWALVDDEDFEVLNKFRWSPHRVHSGGVYARRNLITEGKGNRNILMHHQLIKPPKGKMIDHIDKNGLNNQRSNLRICTNAENMRNRGKSIRNKTGFKGVYFFKGRYVSIIGVNSRNTYLGRFKTPELAFEAYKKASENLHGEFANNGIISPNL